MQQFDHQHFNIRPIIIHIYSMQQFGHKHFNIRPLIIKI
jgi:hypothetical protein